MKFYDTKDLEFEVVEILGFEAFMTDSRVDPETVPEGYWLYELRGGEGLALTLEFGRVAVNFEGTILSRTDFRQYAPLGYLDLCGVELSEDSDTLKHLYEYFVGREMEGFYRD